MAHKMNCMLQPKCPIITVWEFSVLPIFYGHPVEQMLNYKVVDYLIHI